LKEKRMKRETWNKSPRLIGENMFLTWKEIN
jgi:hypothetical protein